GSSSKKTITGLVARPGLSATRTPISCSTSCSSLAQPKQNMMNKTVPPPSIQGAMRVDSQNNIVFEEDDYRIRPNYRQSSVKTMNMN
ncbi:unnamed protein product, partial [Amoebophrya sp. A25]